MTNRDVVVVENADGEQVEVFNHVSVVERHYVNAVNGYETFDPIVSKGDGMSEKPDAVTPRVARLLYDEFGADVDELEIEVIDPEDEEVTVL